MGIKIKIPVKNIEKEDICSTVEETLKKDSENAYTIAGLMIDVFGVKKDDIENKSFSAWKKGLPTMYSRIGNCLRKLEKAGKIKSRKHGKAFVYWYVE